MITTLTAARLGYVRRDSETGWNAQGAMQGMWAEDGTLRTGAMCFDGLRDVDWGSQSIFRIVLTMTFAGAGYGRGKTIGLYRGAQSDMAGSGAAMRGAAIGQFVTNGKAYRSVVTNVFDAENDPGVFAGLTAWLQQSASPILVTYIDEPGGAKYSENYLRISACEMEITHEIAGSGGRLDKQRLDAGDTVTLTIDPIEAEGTVTHSVAWNFGQVTSDPVDPGAGLTASFAVPMEWLYQIPDAPSGEARCLLTTYVDGREQATRTLTFTVDAPASAAPVFDAAVSPSGTAGGYWQYLGGARVSIEDALAMYGAEIAAYSITGAEGVVSAQSAVTTPAFQVPGAHEYVLSVTDTRGMTARRTVSIDVTVLNPPVITAFSVRRYTSFIDDEGETVYRDSLGGGKVRVTIEAAIDTAGGNNVPNAYIVYESAAAAYSGESILSLDWPAGAAALSLTDDRTIITADVPLNSAFAFTLTVGDKHSQVTASSRVEMSWAPVHLAGSGYGVGLGGYSYGTQLRPEVRLYWPLYGMDGYRLDGATSQEITGFADGFEAYSADRAPRISRVGRMVQLTGACRPTAAISGSATGYTMFTLAREFWPERAVVMVCQGSTTHCWMLQVTTDGRVMFSRYRNGDNYASAPTSAMLAFHATWFAADLPAAEEDDGPAGATVTYPAAAMTTANSQDCAVSVSSAISSALAGYKAFDYERSSAWAADSDDAEPWIQLRMPNALKNIRVQAYSWETSNRYKGDPVSGMLMGSTDGVEWTQIGAFDGWAADREGLLGEIVCSNTKAYSHVRLIITEWTGGKAYASIGYMAVVGQLPGSEAENLFVSHLTPGESYESGGFTFVCNADGSFTVSGTNTTGAETLFTIASRQPNTFGGMTLSGGVDATLGLAASLYDADQKWATAVIDSGAGAVIPAQYPYISIGIRILAGTTVNRTIIPKINKGGM